MRKEDILLELQDYVDGNIKHIPVGYKKMKYYVNSFRPGRLTLLGAYTGVGKTFMVLNLINNIQFEAPKAKILIISTEMTDSDYLTRLVSLRAGIYFKDFEDKPLEYAGKLKEEIDKFFEKSEQGLEPEIVGMMNKWEDIEKKIKSDTYDLVFIDFIQDVSVNNKYRPEDTMPILNQKLKNVLSNTHVVAISQVNNKHIERTDLDTMPFAYGIEMIRSASHAIYIRRVKYEESKGVLKNSDYIFVQILKNRYGAEGYFPLKVKHGHVFTELNDEEERSFKDFCKDHKIK